MSFAAVIFPFFTGYYILNVLASVSYVVLKTLHPICEWFFKEDERCELSLVCFLFLLQFYAAAVKLILVLNSIIFCQALKSVNRNRTAQYAELTNIFILLHGLLIYPRFCNTEYRYPYSRCILHLVFATLILYSNFLV